MSSLGKKNGGAEALEAKLERRGRAFKFTLGITFRMFAVLLIATTFGWAYFNGSLSSFFSDLRAIAKTPMELGQGYMVLTFPWERLKDFMPTAIGFSLMASIGMAVFAITKAKDDMEKADFGEDYREITEDELKKDMKGWFLRSRERFEHVSKPGFYEKNDLGVLDGDALMTAMYGQYLTVSKELSLVPEAILASHFGLSGATRTGKTTLIRDLLSQIRFYGHQAFVLDYNGELYKLFGQEGDTILCPFDRRSARYDIFSEDVMPDKVAAGLVAHDIKNSFFSDNGRKLLTSLMQLSTSHETLWQLILKDQTELKTLLLSKGIDTGKLFENNETAGDVISTMQTNLGLLPYLNYWNPRQRPFSIVNWAKNSKRGFVFVIVPDAQIEALRPWMRLFFEMAITGALKRNPDHRNTPLYLITDEVKQLEHLQSFEKAVTNGAKYNLRMVVGWQTDSQMKAVYGDESASILGNIRTRAVFNPRHDNEGVKAASELLGMTDVRELYISETRAERGTSVSLSTQERKKNVIPEASLKSLEQLEFYLKLPFQRPVKMEALLRNIKSKNPGFIEAIPPELTMGGRV
jgi:hypothetical protein